MNKEVGEFLIDPFGEGDDLMAATIRMLSILQKWLQNYPTNSNERMLMENKIIWESLENEEYADLGKNKASKHGFSCN